MVPHESLISFYNSANKYHKLNLSKLPFTPWGYRHIQTSSQKERSNNVKKKLVFALCYYTSPGSYYKSEYRLLCKERDWLFKSKN